MGFSLVYLVHRFLYRIFDFVKHWYVDGTRAFAHRFVTTIEDFDQTFAVGITIRHFFEPLYKDYSIVGRILGLIFRPLRVLLGLTVYLGIAGIFLAAYAVWFSVPLVILYYAWTNYHAFDAALKR
jgi:hypothetical protein